MRTIIFLALALSLALVACGGPQNGEVPVEAVERPYVELDELGENPELFIELGTGFHGIPLVGPHTMSVLVSADRDDPVRSGVGGVGVRAGFIYPGCEDLDGDLCHECLPDEEGCAMEVPGFLETNRFGVAPFRLVTHRRMGFTFAVQLEGRPESQITRVYPVEE